MNPNQIISNIASPKVSEDKDQITSEAIFLNLRISVLASKMVEMKKSITHYFAN